MIVQRATAVASEPTRFLDSVDVKNSESTECVRTQEINMNRLTTVFESRRIPLFKFNWRLPTTCNNY